MKTYLSHCLNPTLNKCKHRYIVEDGCGEVERMCWGQAPTLSPDYNLFVVFLEGFAMDVPLSKLRISERMISVTNT